MPATGTEGIRTSRPRQGADGAEGTAWPSARAAGSSRLGTLLSLVVSMGIVAALMTMLYVRNHRYYFIDDRIADAVPKLMDIGRILRSGEWPWLSTSMVNSGAHAVEYQNNVFNPLNLLLSIPLSQTDDVARGAFLYVLVHGMLLTVAAAWLGRVVGLSTAWTVAFAVSIGFQPYTILWGASAWLQTFVSFSWFVLVVAAAAAFHREPKRRYGWAVLGATFGCCTAGFPLAIIMLGLFALLLLVARLLARLELRQTAWLAAWFAGGLLCALVALYPLVAAFEVASRGSDVVNQVNDQVVSVQHLLQFANPSYYGFFSSFGGYDIQPLPHFYIAWFVLPVLVLWKAEGLRPGPAVLLRVAAGLLVFAAVMSLGPERVLVFRFPTRFVQFYGFALLLVAAVLVAHGRFVFTRKRFAVAVGLGLLLLVNTLQADPTGVSRVLRTGVPAVVLVAALCWLGREQGPARRLAPRVHGALSAATLVGGTAFLLFLLAWYHPEGRGEDWGFPHDMTTVGPLSQDDYTLFYGFMPGGTGNLAGYSEFRPSSMGLMTRDRVVNGYSPLGHRFFREHFDLDDQGNFREGAAAGFTAVDPETGLSYLELLRVDQVIAVKGTFDDEVSPLLGDQWRLARSREITNVYRHPDYTLPGLVSYASPRLEVGDGGCPPRQSRECVAVQAPPDEAGTVVFARLWVPGYEATLDGEPLDVQRHAGMLVAVTVPEGADGELVVSYRSPGFVPLVVLAAVTLLVLLLASSRWGGVRPRARRARSGGRPAEPVPVQRPAVDARLVHD